MDDCAGECSTEYGRDNERKRKAMQDSKNYFDDIALRWDEMRRGFFSEAIREKAFSLAGVQPGELAADIGAGSGFITEGLIQRGVRVIAVDQSEAMLDVMKKKFADHPDNGIAWALRKHCRWLMPRSIMSLPICTSIM